MRALKESWLFGGGKLFRSLLSLRAVDSIEVAVIPVLLGHGLRLLAASAGRTALKLVEQKSFLSGRLLLKYEFQQ